MDYEAASQIVKHIQSAEIVKAGNSQGVGTVVREVRLLNGRRMEAYKTTTAASDNPGSMSVNVHTTESKAISGSKEDIRVSTRTTATPIDDRSCSFVASFAIAPHGFWDSLVTRLC